MAGTTQRDDPRLVSRATPNKRDVACFDRNVRPSDDRDGDISGHKHGHRDSSIKVDMRVTCKSGLLARAVASLDSVRGRAGRGFPYILTSHGTQEMTMKTRSLLVGLAACVAIPAAAFAHAGHVHKIMGTVTARDAKHVEVKTPSGEILSIAVNNDTKVIRAKKKVTFDDVQTGRRVVVDIGDGEDPLIAREIQLGEVKAATK